jgi:hypothetical protein
MAWDLGANAFQSCKLVLFFLTVLLSLTSLTSQGRGRPAAGPRQARGRPAAGPRQALKLHFELANL